MILTVQFERPSFDEITAVIRRTFPMPGSPAITFTPASFNTYFAAGGVRLDWQRIPDWESYERGQRNITDEQFMALLFSPKTPIVDESVFIITDECFREQRGFRVRFKELLAFAQKDYPQLWQSHAHFFQPLDMIFLAEQSRLLVLLHHEGQRTQYADRG
jgi:hypothetical protein